MSKVLIVSRTRMRENRVCVGGIDLDNNRPIRLLDPNGYHEIESECPFNIGDLWECSYVRNPKRPAPHLEDTNVIIRELLEKESCKTSDDFRSTLSTHGIKIFTGSLDNCFESCLFYDGHRYYVKEENVPNYSTCFWINDHWLKNNDYHKPEGGVKKQLAYMNGATHWGIPIAYVGLGVTPNSVIPGSLVRLSLANWWSKAEYTPKRCYLQISWIY